MNRSQGGVASFIRSFVSHEDGSGSSSGFTSLFDAPVFANGQRLVPGVVTAQVVQEGIVDWMQPFLLSDEETNKLFGALCEDECLKKESQDAKNAFSVSEERRHPLKGKGKIEIRDDGIKGTIISKVMSVFKLSGELLHPDACDASDKESEGMLRLMKLLAPDFYLMKGQKPQVYMESAGLPSIKWVQSGTLQTVVLHFNQFGQYVRSKLGGQALKHPVSSQGTTQWLSTAGHTGLNAALVANPNMSVFKVAYGPGHMLYCPPGWLKLELSTDDVVSIRMTVIPQKALANFATDLRVAAADLLAQGKKNLALEAVIGLVKQRAEAAQEAAAQAAQEAEVAGGGCGGAINVADTDGKGGGDNLCESGLFSSAPAAAADATSTAADAGKAQPEPVEQGASSVSAEQKSD